MNCMNVQFHCSAMCVCVCVCALSKFSNMFINLVVFHLAPTVYSINTYEFHNPKRFFSFISLMTNTIGTQKSDFCFCSSVTYVIYCHKRFIYFWYMVMKSIVRLYFFFAFDGIRIYYLDDRDANKLDS